jgi:hypothetical protein
LELRSQPIGAQHDLIVAPDLIRLSTDTAFTSDALDEIFGRFDPVPGIFVFFPNVFTGRFRIVFLSVADKTTFRSGNIGHQVLYLPFGIVRIGGRYAGHHECRQDDQPVSKPSSHLPSSLE